MKKIIKSLVILILVVGIIFVAYTGYSGYKMYKDAITEVSLEDKVNEIKNYEDYVKISDVPQIYKDAVVSVEDHRFYNHNGIDLISTTRAIVTNIISFGFVEGGSTITQQLSKNLYFSQEKELIRKVAELFLAFDLEKNYSKDDILELYINTIYFGDGYYGIKQASLGYFDKEPNELTNYEATLLAGLPNAPSVYSPTVNPDLAHQRQDRVLTAMVEHNTLSQEQADEIRKEALK